MRPEISNDELVEAVEQEADRRDITATEAIRLAIRNFCINGDDTDSEDNDNPARTIDLLDDEDMRSVHRTLWRMGSSDGCGKDLRKVPLSSAKSVVAQLMGVSKEVIQEMYVKPLSRKQITDLKFGASTSQLFIVDPDAPVMIDESDHDAVETVTTDHDPDNAEDRMQELDNSEPVRADGGEKQ